MGSSLSLTPHLSASSSAFSSTSSNNSFLSNFSTKKFNKTVSLKSIEKKDVKKHNESYNVSNIFNNNTSLYSIQKLNQFPYKKENSFNDDNYFSCSENYKKYSNNVDINPSLEEIPKTYFNFLQNTNLQLEKWNTTVNKNFDYALYNENFYNTNSKHVSKIISRKSSDFDIENDLLTESSGIESGISIRSKNSESSYDSNLPTITSLHKTSLFQNGWNLTKRAAALSNAFLQNALREFNANELKFVSKKITNLKTTKTMKKVNTYENFCNFNDKELKNSNNFDNKKKIKRKKDVKNLFFITCNKYNNPTVKYTILKNDEICLNKNDNQTKRKSFNFLLNKKFDVAKKKTIVDQNNNNLLKTTNFKIKLKNKKKQWKKNFKNSLMLNKTVKKTKFFMKQDIIKTTKQKKTQNNKLLKKNFFTNYNLKPSKKFFYQHESKLTKDESGFYEDFHKSNYFLFNDSKINTVEKHKINKCFCFCDKNLVLLKNDIQRRPKSMELKLDSGKQCYIRSSLLNAKQLGLSFNKNCYNNSNVMNYCLLNQKKNNNNFQEKKTNNLCVYLSLSDNININYNNKYLNEKKKNELNFDDMTQTITKNNETITIQASTSELLNGLGQFIQLKCKKIKQFESSYVINWLKAVDKTLLTQGWQDIAFINPANLVFVFLLIQKCFELSFSTNILTTLEEVQSFVLTCLYISYSYMGNEISYPIKPFIAETADRVQFWKQCVEIINRFSADMLRLNSSTAYFHEIFLELKKYSKLN